jgi:aryl-alcohol dehydrogenase-like predicted oxidoreductase
MRGHSLRPDDRAIAAIGCGDVSLARAAARGIDAGDVALALREAIDAGIDLVDVAEDGERVVGDVVRAARARDRVVVACRVAPTEQTPDPRYVQARVEDSLRATRLDAIPLCQLALRSTWRTHASWADLRGACARLVHEGKVLRWGAIVDAHDADVIDRAAPPLGGAADRAQVLVIEDWLATASFAYSVCARDADDAMAAARAAGAVVLAREPLAGGALGGALGPGVKLPRTDDRRALDLERIATGVAKLVAFVREVPPAARSCDPAREALEHALRDRREPIECATVAELALRFVIDRGAIALPRLHRREHVGEAIAAASAAPLSEELVRRVVEQIPPRDA